jgi:hypothetical protein
MFDRDTFLAASCVQYRDHFLILTIVSTTHIDKFNLIDYKAFYFQMRTEVHPT